MAEVALKETAMVRVGNTRVGCGNLWEREYALPDGSTVTGISARVSYDNAVYYVGPGSELVIEGQRWRVVGIDKEPNVLGRVRLETV
jgi:hypothetical protein